MSKISNFMGAAAIVTGLLMTAAQATPIVVGVPIITPPPVITGTGDVKAMYIFSDANDASNLLQTLPPFGLIFCNHSNIADGPCSGPPLLGAVVDLGPEFVPLVFSLHDTTTGNTFLSNAPDSNGDYHAVFTTNYADISSAPGFAGPSAATVAAAVAGLPGTVTFVAWEDHTLNDNPHDFDYNDLIFAFSNIAAGCTERCPVPEPFTLSLFGAGLAGVAAFRRRRKSQKAA